MVYLDDIVVYSEIDEDDSGHLRQVLKRLRGMSCIRKKNMSST